MAKCKKMAVGGPAAPAPMNPKAQAAMLARKKARPLPGPAAGPGPVPPTMMKKGGGVEAKGKTKGKMVAMKSGGKCK